ncbi:MAG: hypothetical protein JOZ38_07375, partial [Candidatus Eremiobacteraeota bacterium]|nr:hypothetical protein [Candidatus Eremiobacteraeota bacterium]
PYLFAADIEKAGLHHGPVGGILIKVLPNAMLEDLDPKIIAGLDMLGMDFPDNAAEIFYECWREEP